MKEYTLLEKYPIKTRLKVLSFSKAAQTAKDFPEVDSKAALFIKGTSSCLVRI